MSRATTPSYPPVSFASAPPLASTEVAASIEGALARLREELAAAVEKPRKARLLVHISHLEEMAGDDAGAARDLLAAFNFDSGFRESLEALFALLERRRSFRNLGRVIDALVRVADSPDEQCRALAQKADYLRDIAHDPAAALVAAREATTKGGSDVEAAGAWLLVELLAARTGDRALRLAALTHRAKVTEDPTWRGLLLCDIAQLMARGGDTELAIATLRQAREQKGQASYGALLALERLALLDIESKDGTAKATRLVIRAEAATGLAELIEDSLRRQDRGASEGVPRWARHSADAVDAWLRASQLLEVAGDLDGAIARLDRARDLVNGDDGQMDAVVTYARIRLALRAGDTELAARLAERRIRREEDKFARAALSLLVADHALRRGDAVQAAEIMANAVAADPTSPAVRALALEAFAARGDAKAEAALYESFAEHVATDAGRSELFLIAAYLWAMKGGDSASAKVALGQAAVLGAKEQLVARLARSYASVTGDVGWYEEATKRLLSTALTDSERTGLRFEVVRARLHGNEESLAKAIEELANVPGARWFGSLALAYLPWEEPRHADAIDALAELSSLEPNAAFGRAFAFGSAVRALLTSNADLAETKLLALHQADKSDVVIGLLLSMLARKRGDRKSCAAYTFELAQATSDPALAGSLFLEAGIERWLLGEKAGAVEAFEHAMSGAPEAATHILAWASNGVDPDNAETRRRALERRTTAGEDARLIALERFAIEQANGNYDAASQALSEVESGHDHLATAARLARLAVPSRMQPPGAYEGAFTAIADLGPETRQLAALLRVRSAQAEGEAEGELSAAKEWVSAGGRLPAALAWLGSALRHSAASEEDAARESIAKLLGGLPAEEIRRGAIAARLGGGREPGVTTVGGGTPAARALNLELAPATAPVARRRSALRELGDALGEDARLDGLALSAWSAIALKDYEGAIADLEQVVAVRPADIASWEGLRFAAESLGTPHDELRARAACELGGRVADDTRGAAFWEECANLRLSLHDEVGADAAFEASFMRDGSRRTAFERLFRRVRERKDGERLLPLIARRLDFTDDPTEITKLFWEQARVLRERGDVEGAVRALEHVTMLDPDHVGALALSGEISIRQGDFAAAAASLARLASLEAAPPKSRVTAGVAAVDLFENKLERFDQALHVLLLLHRAGLSTMAVRERLARAAARTGAWQEATLILEELMRERPDREGRMEAARLAMAIYRDRLADVPGARSAIVALLGESPTDGEAIDMLLQAEPASEERTELLERSRASIAESLSRRPNDLPLARRLVKVCRALERPVEQQAALSLAVAVGATDPGTLQAFAALATTNPAAPQTALSSDRLRALLAPGDTGPVAALFALLGPTLGEALGPSLASCAVAKRDRIDARAGLSLRNEIAAWAGSLGISEFELYIGGKEGHSIIGIAGSTPALVVGPEIRAPLSARSRAQVARELLGIVRGTTLTRWRDEGALLAVVVAAGNLAGIKIDHPPLAALPEIERQLGKAISRKTKKLLPEVCSQIQSQNLPIRDWIDPALASLDRIALVASGDVALVLEDILETPRERLPSVIETSSRARALVGFALSPKYAEYRNALGLEGRR